MAVMPQAMSNPKRRARASVTAAVSARREGAAPKAPEGLGEGIMGI
jgi:hypothetical protein